jgi:AraC family transcriptional regulator
MMTLGTSADSHTLPGSRLRRVTEYIQAHLDQHLTLAHLGSVVFMSPYHFARLFQHSTGLPPHRFVVHARIDHAATLLAAPDLSISQISRVVGFRSPSHFATVFHRIKGVTPSEYRARQGLDAEARRGAVAGPVAQEGGRDGLQ